jgi:hypothetical protein
VRSGIALFAAGVAMLLLALWLRNPVLPYGDDAPAASGAGVSSTNGSSQYDANVHSEALAELRSAVNDEKARLTANATRALNAPNNLDDAFDYLASLGPAPEQGIVLFDGALPLAWSGQVEVDPSIATAPFSVTITPF